MSDCKQRIKASVIQQQCWPDKKKNLEESERLIRQASSEGAQLILLQELHTSLYFCQSESSEYFEYAEALDGSTTKRLGTLAKELNCVIVGSIFEKRMEGVYHNTAIVLDTDGSMAGFYRKMHIPDDPGFYEKYYFTPGDSQDNGQHTGNSLAGFKPIQTSVGNLGVLVCWDQWFPEAARLMALSGADLLLYPTAIGWDPGDEKDEQQRQLDAWQLIQRSHAVANHLPVLVANRAGLEQDNSGHTDGILFWGNSFIAGQQGELLSAANENEPSVLTAVLELNRTKQLRRTWPYFRDRRIDAYSGLLQRVIE